MLSKNCLLLLKVLNLDSNSDIGFSLGRIVKLSKLDSEAARRAAEHLVQEGYLEHRELYHVPGQITPEQLQPFFITELGRCYKQVRREQIWAYIADKWIDILASVVSIISLVVSIIAMSKAG